MTDRRLLILYPTATASVEGGQVHLDDKFVSGMTLHRTAWGGPVHAILRETQAPPPFSRAHDPGELGFGLSVLPAHRPLVEALPDGAGLVLASADSVEQLALGPACTARGIPVVFGIEYTRDTRVRIALSDRSRGLARRLWSAGWNLRQEGRRRRALREADGIQMNGFPAEADYGRLNQRAMRYLDNRMTAALLADEPAMQARAVHHVTRAPLRLIHAGRLEPMKGAEMLVPLARRLAQAGTAFTMDIYGEGSLAPTIRQALAASSLGDRVRLHDPVPFETGLVPLMRETADVFVSLHVQSDPSCVYLEAMGCGLAVVGFSNRMLQALTVDAGAGWTVPMRDLDAMARRIAALDADREAVMRAAQAGLAYAGRHDFQAEFNARMNHLRDVHAAAAQSRQAHVVEGS